MPHNWWTRKTLVLAAATVALACVIGFAAIEVSYPEPVASTTLGRDWQCSRMAFVFTTCSRVKHSEAAPVRVAKNAVCARLRT
jgi:adenine-specific DNA methylase